MALFEYIYLELTVGDAYTLINVLPDSPRCYLVVLDTVYLLLEVFPHTGFCIHVSALKDFFELLQGNVHLAASKQMNK